MPYIFEYFIDNNLYFKDKLKCQRCEAINKNGERCKRTVCIGIPLCYIHLLYKNKLKIKESTIPNSGKGLFVHDPKNTDIVFEKNETITKYYGEIVSKEILDKRYSNFTNSYAIEISERQNIYEDAALKRGIGSIINHNPKKKNVRFGIYKRRIIIKALKNLKHGDELFINYGKDYQFNDKSSHTTKYRSKFV